MKFLHLADLHIGKRVLAYSMLEDQRYIFQQITDAAQKEEIDAVLIAGDIYDTSSPSEEALRLFENFLLRFDELRIPVCLIPGNHDSDMRLAFGSDFMKRHGVHIARPYSGHSDPVVFWDEWGEVHVHLLPFVRKRDVQRCFPDAVLNNEDDVLRTAVEALHVDCSVRNILVAHQFVHGGAISDSEERIGGLDGADPGVFALFEYTALGHLHRPQHIGMPNIRYCGSPLKYSCSEVHHQKNVTIVELRKKSNPVEVREIVVTPRRDMREIRGRFDELWNPVEAELSQDYIHIILTDERSEPDAFLKLRRNYPNLMSLRYERQNGSADLSGIDVLENAESMNPEDMIKELFFKQNRRDMDEKQLSYLRSIIEEVWGTL
ncbi:MAG: exonuclease SbcCD subunit D [Desulfovibrionaceae bacterium]|nr:exonuclease SbcCD subunit D [Desulfovibrionaceae bacterium]